MGGAKEIATDNTLADIDRDGVPDLSIGRIPVDNQLELSEFTRKLIAYENGLDRGIWRRKIQFVAGLAGGFGALEDSLIRSTTMKLLKDLSPKEDV